MKKYWGIIVLSVIFLALLAYVVYAFKFDTKNVSNKVLFETDILNISSVSIDSPISYEVKKTAYGYGLFVPENIPAKNEILEDIVKTCSKIEYESIIEENSKNLGQFGLENPTAVLNIKTVSDSQKVIYFGKKTPVNDGVYVKFDKENTVYKINDIVSNKLTQNVNDIIDKNLLQFNKEIIDRVVLFSNGQNIEFVKEDNLWFYQEVVIDQDLVNQLFDKLQSIEVGGIINKNEYITELSNPEIQFSMFASDKEELAIDMHLINDRYIVIKDGIPLQYYYSVDDMKNISDQMERLLLDI